MKTYYKIVKLEDDKLISAVMADAYQVTYKVGEFVSSPIKGSALFVTDNLEDAFYISTGRDLRRLLNTSEVPSYVAHSHSYEDGVLISEGIGAFAVYTCEVIEKYDLRLPFEDYRSLEAAPKLSSDLWHSSSSILVEQVKLIKQLTRDEILGIIL